MRSFLKFILIFSGILLVSAFLAPILFDFLPFKFEKIFNRIVMILTLLAIAFFVRFRREMFVKYGLVWQKDSLNLWARTFFVSIVLVGILVGTRVFMGHVLWAPREMTFFEWSFRILKVLGAALLIALIEEFFFRGYIYLSLRDRFRWPLFLSLVVTNLFYALIHFIGEDMPFIGPNPTVVDSFRLVMAPFSSLKDWPSFWPGAVGLFLLGLILSDLFIRSGSLYPSMGFHAGCVFFVKMDGLYVDFLNNKSLLWGSSLVYDGVFGWLFLVLMWAIFRGVIPKKLIASQKDVI
ncbi:MAG: CPBP family intramembrane metalloprotease [Candidatus Omnitrophica bacterium]|nr:CPBP family intramembrane metalloprotease [Candidatus Omnitrophota bacterium]